MVSPGGVIGLLVILGAHTVIAAIATRLLRVRLATRWGAAVYIVMIVPVLLVISTFIISGVFMIGPNIGDPGTAVFLTVFVPFAIGVTIDYIWMPAPDDVALPEAPE